MPLTKQTVAIIGADQHTGSAIAKRISDCNYRLLLLSKELAKVQPLAEEIIQSNSNADVEVMNCQYDACWEADVIIMAAPHCDQKEVAALIEEVATQKIVIRIANSNNETLETSSGTDTAEELKELLPHSKIVSMFSNDFTNPVIGGKKAEVLIAGENEIALEMASELMGMAGFNPVIVADLTSVRR